MKNYRYGMVYVYILTVEIGSPRSLARIDSANSDQYD